MIYPQVALSIRQPHAHHILFDGKDVENRTWRTRFQGPILIHAGKSEVELERAELGLHPLGGIVGMAEIVGCVEGMESRWFYGPYGFVLRNPQPLEFVPCKGALGFFRPDIDFATLRPLPAAAGKSP